VQVTTSSSNLLLTASSRRQMTSYHLNSESKNAPAEDFTPEEDAPDVESVEQAEDCSNFYFLFQKLSCIFYILERNK
jgi:hypothetical protein